MASKWPSSVGYNSHAAMKAPVFVQSDLNGGLGAVETEITELSSSLSSGTGLGPAGVLLVFGRCGTAWAAAAAAAATGGARFAFHSFGSKSWSLMVSLVVRGLEKETEEKAAF